MNSKQSSVAILGAGNIGCAIATGLVESGEFTPSQIHLTRRTLEKLNPFKKSGYRVTADNLQAAERSDIIIICVEPNQIDTLLSEIGDSLDASRHLVISVVSGVTINSIKQHLSSSVPVVRAMPNTAIAIRESMTCICSEPGNPEAVEITREIFNSVGITQVIREEQMTSATALCACGIAFFLRAVRAASQGGIEIGFHSHESLTMAAQTAKGAASLLAEMKNHPEYEIDRVTTPLGCTISGLNRMEHEGFSSAMIKGILHSAEKAGGLYKKES